MKLEKLRKGIDSLDAKLVDLLSKRRFLSLSIKEIKKKEKIRIYSPEREKQVIDRCKSLSRQKGLDPYFVEKVFKLIIKESKKIQYENT